MIFLIISKNFNHKVFRHFFSQDPTLRLCIPPNSGGKALVTIRYINYCFHLMLQPALGVWLSGPLPVSAICFIALINHFHHLLTGTKFLSSLNLPLY